MNRNRIKLILLPMIFFASFDAWSASVPNEVKEPNTKLCIDIANSPAAKTLDKYAPSDKSKVSKYCTCVSDRYWNSVPQSDYDGMVKEMQAGKFDGSHNKSISDHVDERLQTAQKACAGN